MIVTETIAFSKEERTEASLLEMLRARLWQSKLNRQPKSNTKRMIKRHVILDYGATSTFMRPQDGAIPTGETTKRVHVSDGRTVQVYEKARLPRNKLRDKARECDILPHLEHTFLVSEGKLADAGITSYLCQKEKEYKYMIQMK